MTPSAHAPILHLQASVVLFCQGVGSTPEAATKPHNRYVDHDSYLSIKVGILAGVADVLGSAAFFRYERKRAEISGIAPGGLAIGVQLFTCTVMLIVDALVISSVIYALLDAFGDMFGGLFGR